MTEDEKVKVKDLEYRFMLGCRLSQKEKTFLALMYKNEPYLFLKLQKEARLKATKEKMMS